MKVLCGAHDSTEKGQYSGYLRTQSACEKVSSILISSAHVYFTFQVIRRDIARTYPEHDFFKRHDKEAPGQEKLFNVMKAYSVYDREVSLPFCILATRP